MKYFLLLYIALGFTLSMLVHIEYTCTGEEMFPDYYGSPFIFKQKSLASSMEYYFSVSGLVFNTLIWSAFLFMIHRIFLKVIQRLGNLRILHIIYKGVIISLFLLTSLFIYADYEMNGGGFDEGLNYWYMDLDSEAQKWGMECEGEWKILYH